MTLTEIANKYMTDKGTTCSEAHGYTNIYSDYIPSKGKHRLLEIGILYGCSIRTWNEYNPELEIYGVDISNDVFNHLQESENIHICIGNQSDKIFLESLPYDLDFVIDDGSHNYNDIMTSFSVLYNHLSKNGIYFIEDLHAPYSERENIIKNIGVPFELWNNKLMIIRKV